MNLNISFIIPVYNCEGYLNECLDSIINQNYQYIEIIIINDASTDNSLNICNKYAQKDNRVKLITNKRNLGVSATRNIGIEKSTGDVIIFIDSDDYIEKDYIQKIITLIGKYDLLCYGYNCLYKNTKIPILLNKKINNKDVFENKVMIGNEIAGYLWNKVFKSDIVKSNNIKFNENIHYCEDLLFVSQYLKYSNSVYYFNDCLYNYRMRKNSASYNFFNKKNSSILYSYLFLIEKYKNNELIENHLKYMYLIYYYCFKKYGLESDMINKNILKEENKIILYNNLNFKSKLKFLIIKHLNFLYKFLKKHNDKKLKLYN